MTVAHTPARADGSNGRLWLPDAAVPEVLVAVEVVVDGAVEVEEHGVDGEVPPAGVQLPVSGKLHLGNGKYHGKWARLAWRTPYDKRPKWPLWVE